LKTCNSVCSNFYDICLITYATPTFLQMFLCTWWGSRNRRTFSDPYVWMKVDNFSTIKKLLDFKNPKCSQKPKNVNHPDPVQSIFNYVISNILVSYSHLLTEDSFGLKKHHYNTNFCCYISNGFVLELFN
jgi:hypothetical protein